jgi:hypothetical protein
MNGPGGRKTRRKQETVSWRQLLGRVARTIRRAAGEPIARSGAQRMARYLVSVLVPRRQPGRKATPEVLKAAALKQEGKPWRAIYPVVFEDYPQMPAYERSWRCHRLRRAVAASLKRRARREGRPAGKGATH